MRIADILLLVVPVVLASLGCSSGSTEQNAARPLGGEFPLSSARASYYQTFDAERRLLIEAVDKDLTILADPTQSEEDRRRAFLLAKATLRELSKMLESYQDFQQSKRMK